MKRHAILRCLLAVASLFILNQSDSRASWRDATPGITLAQLRQLAEAHEVAGEWERACSLYHQVLARDPRASRIRERYHYCWRRDQQARRLEDPAYRAQAGSLSLRDSLKVYAEVLLRLQASYVDRVQLERLVAHGLDELRFAIDRRIWLERKKPTLDQLIELRVALDQLDPKDVRKLSEAQDLAREAAELTEAHLGWPAALAVLEMMCGACTGLDAYTFYQAQAPIRAESSAASTIETARLLDAMLGIGYLRITSFKEDTPRELDAVLLKLQAQGIRTLILDLRGNLGGDLKAAVQTAERFLPTGIIVTLRGHSRPFNQMYESHAMAPFPLPLVVLVDGETASSAELLAASLKDNKRATLVGQTTFGKGTIQTVRLLRSVPAAVRLTVARFYSPMGQSIQGRGVTPHLSVVREEPATQLELDSQVQAAVQVARSLLMDR